LNSTPTEPTKDWCAERSTAQESDEQRRERIPNYLYLEQQDRGYPEPNSHQGQHEPHELRRQ
jgi:hypothetical protein